MVEGTPEDPHFDGLGAGSWGLSAENYSEIIMIMYIANQYVYVTKNFS
jgi:hypothetical protein